MRRRDEESALSVFRIPRGTASGSRESTTNSRRIRHPVFIGFERCSGTRRAQRRRRRRTTATGLVQDAPAGEVWCSRLACASMRECGSTGLAPNLILLQPRAIEGGAPDTGAEVRADLCVDLTLEGECRGTGLTALQHIAVSTSWYDVEGVVLERQVCRNGL